MSWPGRGFCRLFLVVWGGGGGGFIGCYVVVGSQYSIHTYMVACMGNQSVGTLARVECSVIPGASYTPYLLFPA